MSDFPNKELFIKNRKKLIEKLKTNSIAIINSNEVYISNADATLPFIQNSNLIYLSGINQPDVTLVLQKKNKDYKEFLFIKNQSKKEIIWQGEKLNKKNAEEISGINEIYYNEDFEKIFKNLISKAEYIYLNKNEKKQLDISKDKKFYNWCIQINSTSNYLDLEPIIKTIRTIKEKIEIDIIREACEITNNAFRKIMKKIKPEIFEYEIEAEFIYQFKKIGCKGFAYNPIVASGKNSCFLHYEENTSKLKDGDLVLLDIGVKYKNYNSDITRTFPVNGKFTKRQKVIYNSVLFVMKQAKKLLKPGITFKDYNKKVNEIMESQLLEIGLINQIDIKNQNPLSPAFRKYFMHGVSHHLGLDVHDNNNYDLPITKGMVLTIEPGIYIKDENIGIRLETDILITEKGIEDLGENIPLEINEIENLMK